MTEIRKWLQSIGLGQYADAFETNAIDMDLLSQIDDQILKDIRVLAAGHRLRIRNAIAKLTPAPVAEVNLSGTTPKHETTAAFAERRRLTSYHVLRLGRRDGAVGHGNEEFIPISAR
jgi:hypothetical protein